MKKLFLSLVLIATVQFPAYLHAANSRTESIPLADLFFGTSYYAYASYHCKGVSTHGQLFIEIRRQRLQSRVNPAWVMDWGVQNEDGTLDERGENIPIHEVYQKTNPPRLLYFKSFFDFAFNGSKLESLHGKPMGTFRCQFFAERK